MWTSVSFICDVHYTGRNSNFMDKIFPSKRELSAFLNGVAKYKVNLYVVSYRLFLSTMN